MSVPRALGASDVAIGNLGDHVSVTLDGIDSVVHIAELIPRLKSLVTGIAIGDAPCAEIELLPVNLGR